VLPDSKEDFPKLLYLDQCKWIDLARAYHGRPGGESFHDALEATQRAVASGKLLIPFSLVNAAETAAAPDRDRRNRPAEFLVQLSRGYTILPFTATIGWEMANALRQLLRRGSPIHVRYSLIGQGIGHACGKRLRVEAATPALEAAEAREVLSPRRTLSDLQKLGECRELIQEIHKPEESRSGKSAILGSFARGAAETTTRFLTWRPSGLSVDPSRPCSVLPCSAGRDSAVRTNSQTFASRRSIRCTVSAWKPPGWSSRRLSCRGGARRYHRRANRCRWRAAASRS
jgi:hypothetical protein